MTTQVPEIKVSYSDMALAVYEYTGYCDQMNDEDYGIRDLFQFADEQVWDGDAEQRQAIINRVQLGEWLHGQGYRVNSQSTRMPDSVKFPEGTLGHVVIDAGYVATSPNYRVVWLMRKAS